jgi:hypothetical protein
MEVQMKKNLLVILVTVLALSKVFAQDAYWTEGFENANLTTALAGYNTIALDTGDWILNSAKAGTSTQITTGKQDLRMVKPTSSTADPSGTAFCYAITPKLASGVGVVTLAEGRGSVPITIDKSTDDGKTWTLVGTVTAATAKTTATITVNDAKANRIRISNQTTGTGKDADVDDVTITKYTSVGVEQEIGLPSSYSLDQNYPNPFNPSTKISFSISQNGFTRLIVYNLLGKEVAQLVNRDLNAGNYSFEFNAKNLPSGLYLYSLISGNYSVTKKMLLIK